MNPETCIEELGIRLPDAAPNIASYARSVWYGDILYVSGQLPLLDAKLVHSGKVGVSVSCDEAVVAARQCAINAIAALKAEAGDLSRVTKIIKLTGYVASASSFTRQSQVIDGASDLFVAVFGEAGRHARSAVGVASLPLDAPVEIELMVALGREHPYGVDCPRAGGV